MFQGKQALADGTSISGILFMMKQYLEEVGRRMGGRAEKRREEHVGSAGFSGMNV